MADRFPGKITLGGTVVIKTIEQRELVETALSEFADWCSAEYGDSSYGSMSIEEARENLKDGYLVGVHDQARGGRFEEVEDACRAAGISYDAHASAAYEYDAEVVRWRPGMEDQDIQIATESEEVVIGINKIKEIIAQAYDLSDFQKRILAETGEDIPGLEPLVIIDEAPNEDEED